MLCSRICGFALLLASSLSAREKTDPRLAQVEKIFVTGNSRSATELRKALADIRAKARWKNVCISGVTNEDDADAVMEIVETVPLGTRDNGIVRLPSSAATLTIRSGDLIWSDDSQYSGVFMLKRLNEAVCRAQGLK